MDDFRPMRVGAIPERHRGGLLESWQAYAEWLEQFVAWDAIDTKECALPQGRRLAAARIARREGLTLAKRRRRW